MPKLSDTMTEVSLRNGTRTSVTRSSPVRCSRKSRPTRRPWNSSPSRTVCSCTLVWRRVPRLPWTASSPSSARPARCERTARAEAAALLQRRWKKHRLAPAPAPAPHPPRPCGRCPGTCSGPGCSARPPAPVKPAANGKIKASPLAARLAALSAASTSPSSPVPVTVAASSSGTSKLMFRLPLADSAPSNPPRTFRSPRCARPLRAAWPSPSSPPRTSTSSSPSTWERPWKARKAINAQKASR